MAKPKAATAVDGRQVALVRLASEIAPKLAAAAISGSLATALVAVFEFTTHVQLPGAIESLFTLVVALVGGYVKADTIPDLAAWLKAAQAADPRTVADVDSTAAQVLDAAAPAYADFLAELRRALPEELVTAALVAGPTAAAAIVAQHAGTIVPEPSDLDETAVPDPDALSAPETAQDGAAGVDAPTRPLPARQGAHVAAPAVLDPDARFA